MILKTNFFGEIKVNKDKIINFEDGLPGFTDYNEFLFMTDNDENSPFCWLQSIEDISLVFTLFNPFAIFKDYEPSLSKNLLDSLGELKEEDLFLYCIATIPKNVADISINLKAPIVINTNTNKARQIICGNEKYKIKHFIYNQFKKEAL